MPTTATNRVPAWGGAARAASARPRETADPRTPSASSPGPDACELMPAVRATPAPSSAPLRGSLLRGFVGEVGVALVLAEHELARRAQAWRRRIPVEIELHGRPELARDELAVLRAREVARVLVERLVRVLELLAHEHRVDLLLRGEAIGEQQRPIVRDLHEPRAHRDGVRLAVLHVRDDAARQRGEHGTVARQ